MTRCAAIAIVCRPDEQNRLTVTPETVIGQPAISAIWRAMFSPVAPSGVAQPISTSSTSPASMPARSIAAFTATPAHRGAVGHVQRALQDLARPVRAVETMTASRISDSFLQMAPAQRPGAADRYGTLAVQPLKPLPSAASFASSGAGFQQSGSPFGVFAACAAKSFRRFTTL